MTKNDKRLTVLKKEVIVHHKMNARSVIKIKITIKITIKRYMNIWHECLVIKNPSRYFGEISQLNNWILDSGLTCHMTLQVSDFIPGLLEDMDKYNEVSYGNHVMAKKK